VHPTNRGKKSSVCTGLKQTHTRDRSPQNYDGPTHTPTPYARHRSTVYAASARPMHMHVHHMHVHVPPPDMLLPPGVTESTREFSTPLQNSLDTPGIDFVVFEGSMMVERKSARLFSSRRGGPFLFRSGTFPASTARLPQISPGPALNLLRGSLRRDVECRTLDLCVAHEAGGMATLGRPTDLSLQRSAA
jgi:hypothetical protein